MHAHVAAGAHVEDWSASRTTAGSISTASICAVVRNGSGSEPSRRRRGRRSARAAVVAGKGSWRTCCGRTATPRCGRLQIDAALDHLLAVVAHERQRATSPSRRMRIFENADTSSCSRLPKVCDGHRPDNERHGCGEQGHRKECHRGDAAHADLWPVQIASGSHCVNCGRAFPRQGILRGRDTVLPPQSPLPGTSRMFTTCNLEVVTMMKSFDLARALAVGGVLITGTIVTGDGTRFSDFTPLASFGRPDRRRVAADHVRQPGLSSRLDRRPRDPAGATACPTPAAGT